MIESTSPSTVVSVSSTTNTHSVSREKSQASRHRGEAHLGDKIFYWLLKLVGWSMIIVVLGIILMLLRMAWPVLTQSGWKFYFSDDWNPPMEIFGALPFIYGTLLSSVLAILFAAPVSIGVAIFLTELAPPWMARIIGFLVEMLAAIPSVVYGLWGVFVLSPFMQASVQPLLTEYFGPDTVFANLLGYALEIVGLPLFLLAQLFSFTTADFSSYAAGAENLAAQLFAGPHYGVGVLTTSIILAIMVTPTISAISREVFMTISSANKEAALGLGATRWEMIKLSVLRASRAGMVGAIILGLGRALGETMAVTMVIGNRNIISAKLMAPGQTMASVIANEYPEATGLHLAALAGVGLSLFAISLLINSSARYIIWRAEKAGGA